MKEVVWPPPILQLKIERNQGTVWASSRADVYEWIINVDQRTAVTNKDS
jgi:hypothetical protein